MISKSLAQSLDQRHVADQQHATEGSSVHDVTRVGVYSSVRNKDCRYRSGILTVRVVKRVKELLEVLPPHGEIHLESDDCVSDTAPDAAEIPRSVGEIHHAVVGEVLRTCADGVSVWFSVGELLEPQLSGLVRGEEKG